MDLRSNLLSESIYDRYCLCYPKRSQLMPNPLKSMLHSNIFLLRVVFVVPLNFHYYIVIILKFLKLVRPSLMSKWNNVFIESTVKNFFGECNHLIEEIFEDLEKEKALELYQIILENKEMKEELKSFLNRCVVMIILIV